jgi:hypothetical protein
MITRRVIRHWIARVHTSGFSHPMPGFRTRTECRFELTLKNLEIEPPQVFKIQRTLRNSRQNGANLRGVRSQVSAQELGQVGTVWGYLTLSLTLKTAFFVQTSKKRETSTETVSRFTFGRPNHLIPKLTGIPLGSTLASRRMISNVYLDQSWSDNLWQFAWQIERGNICCLTADN